MTNNANLLKNIFSYLKPKDLASVEQVSTHYYQNAKNFNSYWREECNDYFCTDYEHYSLEKQMKEYFHVQANSKEVVDWKKLFTQGIKNREIVRKFKSGEGLAYLNLEEDLQNTENLLHFTLKEYLALPKLRRENFYLENELNTAHQTHNYEFLYDQQDLYDYYNTIFNGEQCKDNFFSINGITGIKREDLPFASLLQNFMDVLLLFNKSDAVENKLNLGKLRWYSCEDKFIFDCEGPDLTIQSQSSGLAPSNPIIFILKSIIGKIIIFCRITLNYLKKYEFNENYSLNFLFSNGSCAYTGTHPSQSNIDQMFLSEYLKRYKSFFEAAIHINEEMENLNVLVNYLYENSFEHYPNTPKFSIYRLMAVIWNKEVLHPLLNSENKNFNLFSKIEKLYRQYLTNEISREVDGQIISEKEIKNSPKHKSPNGSLSNSFSSFSNSFMDMNSKSEKSDISRLSNLSICQDNSYEFCPFEEFVSSDFNTKHLIEQISASILDSDCNEFSTFYVNYTQMKTSKYYSDLEEIFSNTMEDVLRKSYLEKPESKYKIFRLFKDFDCHIKFINKTKLGLIKTLCRVSAESSVEDLVHIFQNFLQGNIFTEKEAENYFKINQKVILLGNKIQSTPEIQSIHNQLLQLAYHYLGSEKLAEYATVYFVREIKKNSELSIHNHQIIRTVEEAIGSYYDEFKRLEELNNKILKENKRRNINYKMKESDELLLSYVTVELAYVEEMYLKEMKIETEMFEKELFFRERQSELNFCEKINNMQDDDLSLRSTLGSIYDLECNVDMEINMSDNFIS